MEKTMKGSISSLFVIASMALAAVGAGCKPMPMPLPTQSPKAPALPNPGPDQEYEVKFPEEGGGATRYIRLAIGDDLSKDCGLLRAHFNFDSAEPLPQDKIALRDISDCLNKPELQGKDIVIVGRTDARGSEDYNYELGRKRADAVKKLLMQAGVAEERIVTTSTGKADSMGEEKGTYSYGFDRRVDVLINSTAHRPR